MPTLYPGRYTTQIEGPFVVFLIGMRINRFLAINKWLPVARSMPPMLQELAANKESGFLHAEFAIQWPGVTTIQYWRNFEALHAYAATIPTRLDRQFDLLHDATLNNPEISAFLQRENPDAHAAMAARFAEARQRGLWHPARNAVDA